MTNTGYFFLTQGLIGITPFDEWVKLPVCHLLPLAGQGHLILIINMVINVFNLQNTNDGTSLPRIK